MAVRSVTCPQTQRFNFHLIAAMQGYQAVRRAHKADTAPAWQFTITFQLVGHNFGNRQIVYRFAERIFKTN